MTNRSQLDWFLQRLPPTYHLLLTEGVAWSRYETLYFDTPDRRSFRDHIRGRRPRIKVRVRHHVERRQAFLEVKKKTGDEHTQKWRKERPFEQQGLDSEDLIFVGEHTPFPATGLVPTLETHFRRATLLATDSGERLTIDLQLRWKRPDVEEALAELVVIELKQLREARHTPAAALLRALGMRKNSFSKYCAGVALLLPLEHPVHRKVLMKTVAKLGSWKAN